ncbi:MgtC/SapB family protein [Candidatus Woesearchaeota archaeon]|nr:MgtC/SapB family protein [Candidatus Woesearchaeota archaeon]
MIATIEQLELALKLLFAAFLGYLMAYDRRQQGKGAGMRTFGMIATGSCLFSLVSANGFATADPARIAAQIVTGIGFIGAGVIWKNGSDIVGVTTAAGLWVAAAVGMAVAADLYILAASAALITVLIFNSRRMIPSA